MTTKKPTRKSSPPIKVYCLPSEKAVIEENAASVGKSVSAFLLAVGQGYQVSGIVDYEQVRVLSKINGDLGRLGGLLKLWLTNDERTAMFGAATINAVLSKIEANQEEMARVMMSIVTPRTSQ